MNSHHTYYGCGTCLVYLAHTVTVSSAQARRYQQYILQRYLFGSLAQGCCPSTVLQSVWEVFVAHQKFGWNIFASGGRSAKFAKLEIHKKVSPILAILEDWHFWKKQLVLRSGLCCKRPTHIKRRPIGCSLQKKLCRPKVVGSSTCCCFSFSFNWNLYGKN